MRSQQTLVVCAFGWGKEFRLYHDYLSAEGRNYRLQELTGVNYTCRTVLGVASASLKLHFGSKKLTLRGIPAIDDARRVAEYLAPWCKSADSILHERVTRPVETPPPPALRLERHTQKQKIWRLSDTSKKYARIDTLPIVAVPVRLGRGEQAYYSTRATLCGERIQETSRYTYPAQDHGLLIVTDRRIIYIGRKSQLILDYARLLHVSHLRGAVAFEADHWQKRVIFEVSRPEDCASCIDAMLSTLKREESPLEQRDTQPGSPVRALEAINQQ
ncbi:MAG TPA: hypothetical protein VNE38_08325 [Ktedonobacteraceae bacterium]|nr:hypothetical protein [Ktedonobacteraceae bacterium]